MSSTPNWLDTLFAKSDDEIVVVPYSDIEDACRRLRINPPSNKQPGEYRAGDLKEAMRRFTGEGTS